jgi:hypothetical protein
MTHVSRHKSRKNYLRQLLERFDRYCQLLNLHQPVIDGKWFQIVRLQIKAYVSELYPKTIEGAAIAIKIDLFAIFCLQKGYEFVRNFLTEKSEIVQLTVFPSSCRYEHLIVANSPFCAE